jgi:DNA processing protein
MRQWKCVDEIRPRVKEIYGEGDWNLLDEGVKRLAIVGSRHMTEYGWRVIEKMMPVLVKNGVVIVSGFMYGVDMRAHKSCVDLGGKTIAVLGWGLTTERRHKWIVDAHGLVLSEWEKEAAQPWMFAARNRIVAGISDGVLVVEAAMGSGSLITADWAMKMNKKLMAIGGSVTSRVSKGTNWLIKSGKARWVESGEEVLSVLGVDVRSGEGESVGWLGCLGDEGKTVDELAKIMKVPVEKLLPELMMMVMEGKIKERGGRYFDG